MNESKGSTVTADYHFFTYHIKPKVSHGFGVFVVIASHKYLTPGKSVDDFFKIVLTGGFTYIT